LATFDVERGEVESSEAQQSDALDVDPTSLDVDPPATWWQGLDYEVEGLATDSRSDMVHVNIIGNPFELESVAPTLDTPPDNDVDPEGDEAPADGPSSRPASEVPAQPEPDAVDP